MEEGDWIAVGALVLFVLLFDRRLFGVTLLGAAYERTRDAPWLATVVLVPIAAAIGVWVGWMWWA